MSLNLAEILRYSAEQHPKRPAISIGNTVLSYGALDGAARRFAGALRTLGVGRGQNVALLLPNVPQFTMAYFGALYEGAAVAPLNVLLTATEVAYHLEDSEATTLVVWEGFLEAGAAGFARAHSCKHLVVVRANPADTAAPDGAYNCSALIAAASPVEDTAPTMPDDTAIILYTSGTTGRPKGAELSHFNMYYNAEYARTDLLGLNDTDIGLGTLPLFHSFGQTVVQNALLSVGAQLVLLPRFTPADALTLMAKHKVTFFAGVPTMYYALLHAPEAAQHDVSSLRLCVSGGSALPVEVLRAFDAKFNVSLLEGYGLSETSPIASFNLPTRPRKPGCIGVPIRGVQFRLEADDGSVVTEADKPGEICIKGHNIMKGYLRNPAATEEAIKDGWFHSGDIGCRDVDGDYRIVDRKKDMILRGGFNVYPREIEEVLYAYPDIGEAAVIGVPHDSHGEEVVAVVTAKPGAHVDEAAVIAYCRQQLAAYKYPRSVLVWEALPKGPTGKILKREIRATLIA